MSWTPLAVATNAVPVQNLTYSIKSLYIGNVVNNYGSIPKSVEGNIGFKTYHYVK